MMMKDNHKITHSSSDCTMKRRANTCGNVQLNITHSSGCVHLHANHLLDRISSEWDRDSDTPVAPKFKPHNKVVHDDRYSSSAVRRNDSPDVNRMSYVNVKKLLLQPRQPQAQKHRPNQHLCRLRHHLLFKLLFKIMPQQIPQSHRRHPRLVNC